MGSDDRGEVRVLVDGGDLYAKLEQHSRIRLGRITHLAAVPGATASGRAAAAFVGRLKDGSVAYLHTPLRLLLAAVSQWRTAYGLEADGQSPGNLNAATRERLQAALMVKLIRDREGSEATFNIDEINSVMQDPAQNFEVEYHADGKHLTVRATRSN